jgi:hypothetical protein
MKFVSWYFMIILFFVLGLLPLLILKIDINIAICFGMLFVVLFIFFLNFVLKIKDFFNFSLFSYYIIFLYIAPIFQIFYNKFPNNLILLPEYASMNICLSLLFLVLYMIICKTFIFNNNIKFYKLKLLEKAIESKSFIFSIFFVSLLIIFLFKSYLIDYIIFGITNVKIIDSSNVSIYLIVKRFLFFIPLIPFLILFSKKEKNNLFLFLLTMVLALIVKNPLNERRGLLGSIYLSWIFYYLYIKNFSRKKSFFVYSFYFILFLMLFFYPSIKVFTHGGYSLENMLINSDKVKEGFRRYLENFEYNVTSLDYDSWINAQMTLEYVDKYGHAWGKQTLTSFLFFVPRKFLRIKGEGTGGIIGDYLIANYGSFQRQISNPFYSESFYDFSFFGLLIYAFILSFLRSLSLSLKKSNIQYLILYSFFIDFYVFYLFRGDFISSLAYFSGYTISVIFVPLFFGYLTQFLRLKRNFKLK